MSILMSIKLLIKQPFYCLQVVSYFNVGLKKVRKESRGSLMLKVFHIMKGIASQFYIYIYTYILTKVNYFPFNIAATEVAFTAT